MLTPNQEKYLLTIPESKIFKLQKFDLQVKKTAMVIISKIKKVLPEAKVLFMGSSALDISGQNDIDITILSNGKWEECSYVLNKEFGESAKSNSTLIKWEFVENGFEVELYLNDTITPLLQEQIDTFNLLKDNQELRDEYEKIKQLADGGSFGEYMKMKYEFFNRILQIAN